MCQCSSSDLFWYGCRCGSFRHEGKRVFFNGKLYMIAHHIIEARDLALKETPEQENYETSWLQGDGNGWRGIPDDEILTLGFEGSQYSLHARDWAETYPPGFLAIS